MSCLGSTLRQRPVDWDAFLARLAARPDEGAQLLGPGARTSLIDVLLRAPPPHVVRALALEHDAEFQRCCARRDDKRGYPLDAAIEAQADGEVIRAVLGAHPAAADGATLHSYLHFCESDERTARALLDACPGAARWRRGRRGSLALHYSMGDKWFRRVAPPAVVRLLVAEGGDLLLAKNVVGSSPLEVLLATIDGRSARLGAQPLSALNAWCPHLWDTLTLILQETYAARFGVAMARPHEEALHAAIELRCPQRVLDYAAFMSPERSFSTRGGGKGRGGRLPLHLAAETGMRWPRLELILRKERRAADTRDAATGMFPFMLAAAANDQADIDSIYELLRDCPHVLRAYCGRPLSVRAERSRTKEPASQPTYLSPSRSWRQLHSSMHTRLRYQILNLS